MVSVNNVFVFQDAVANKKYIYQKGKELVAVDKNAYWERFVCWMHGYSKHSLGQILSVLGDVLSEGYLKKLSRKDFAQLHNDIVDFHVRVKVSKFWNAVAVKPFNKLSELFQNERKQRETVPVPKKMPLTKAEKESLSSGLKTMEPQTLPSQPQLAQPTVAVSDPEARVEKAEESGAREDIVLDEGYKPKIDSTYGTERQIDSEKGKQEASWFQKALYTESTADKDHVSNPVREKEERNAFETRKRPVEEQGVLLAGSDFLSDSTVHETVRKIEVDETSERFVPKGVQMEDAVATIHSRYPELPSDQLFDDVAIHDAYFPSSHGLEPVKVSRANPEPVSTRKKDPISKSKSTGPKRHPTRGKRILLPVGKLRVDGQEARFLAQPAIIDNFDSHTAGRVK